MFDNKEIRRGANVVDGHITYEGVAQAFDMPCTSIDSLLGI